MWLHTYGKCFRAELRVGSPNLSTEYALLENCTSPNSLLIRSNGTLIRGGACGIISLFNKTIWDSFKGKEWSHPKALRVSKHLGNDKATGAVLQSLKEMGTGKPVCTEPSSWYLPSAFFS